MSDITEAQHRRSIVEWLLIGLGYIVATAALTSAGIWLDVHDVIPRGAVALMLLAYMGCVALAARAYHRSRVARGLAEPMRAPMKRYQQRFLPAMGVYVVALWASVWIYKTYELPPPVLWLVAIAPAIPIVVAIAAIGLYLKEEDDEFQRNLAISAYVWATGLTLALSTVWGFLEQFKLVPHLPAWFVFPLLACCLVPAQAIARWRYR